MVFEQKHATLYVLRSRHGMSCFIYARWRRCRRKSRQVQSLLYCSRLMLKLPSNAGCFDAPNRSAVDLTLTSGNSAIRQFGSGGAAVSTLYRLNTGLSNQFAKLFSPYLQRLTDAVKTRGVSFANPTAAVCARLVHPFVSHRAHATVDTLRIT